MGRPRIQSRIDNILKNIIIDKEDKHLLFGKPWSLTPGGYAYLRNEKKGKERFLHRMIISPKKGFFIDHINGNRLDNRRANLRVVTKSQNCMNSFKRKNTSSKYKGVHFFKRTNSYQAYINRDKKRTQLGYFKSEKQAAIAYDSIARKLFGDFAKLNFPKNGERSCLK